MTSPIRMAERALDIGLATRRMVEAVAWIYAATQLGACMTIPELLDSGVGSEPDTAEDAAMGYMSLITHGEQCQLPLRLLVLV